MPVPQKKLIPSILLLLMLAAIAAPPLWWSDGDPPVIVPGVPQNNHGPANIGQAKHMAKSALDALRPILPDVTVQIEADLAPIVDFTVPNPKTSAWKEKQKAPLLIGQLKAIADPFYTRLHSAAPEWLEAERIANGTNHLGSIFPWTGETTDDKNKGIANIGQLKAVFSLRFEALAIFDSDGDGMPDIWEIANDLDPSNPADAYADPDGDDITNKQEKELGTNPNSFDQIGPVNIGFSEEITDSPDLTFRPEKPSDLYPEVSVPHWRAAIGQHIEIWDEGDGNPYAELQSHWDAKGIEQEFNMLPGGCITFILRYKGRYEAYSDSNPFTLKVEGAQEVLVNGQPAQTQGSVKQKSFMVDDEWEKYAVWHYASISIIVDPEATTLVPITLTLIPEDTDEAITYGGFVDLIPVDITVVFGIGAGPPPGELNSRELLEEYLETIKIAREEDFWVLAGKDEADADKLYVVEVADTEEKLLHALGTKGRTVIFDGHANFGLGPNFSVSTFKTVEDFTNFGVNQTDIPRSYRGDGNEPDPMPYYKPEWIEINTGDEEMDLKLIFGRSNLNSEGWAYLVLQPEQVSEDVMNYTVPHIGGLRYVNNQGKGHEEVIAKQGVGFNNEWHFTRGGENEKHLVVSAPNTEVPHLRYETFFYNACDTGKYFIENFEHNTFVYTKSFCEAREASKIFIQGLIEAKTMNEIMTLLNDPNVHGREDFPIIYGYENF